DLPVLGRVDALVAQLMRARSHALAKCFWKAVQRCLRNAQGLQAGVADGDGDPRVTRLPPIGGGLDVWRQPADEVSAGQRVVAAEDEVRGDIGRRSRPQDGGLDFVEV